MPVWRPKAVKSRAILTALNSFDGSAGGQQLKTIDEVVNALVIMFIDKLPGLRCNSVRPKISCYWPRIPSRTLPGQFTSDFFGVSTFTFG